MFHSYAFDFAVWEMWGALLTGGRLVVVDYNTSRSPEALMELVARERVTVLSQTLRPSTDSSTPSADIANPVAAAAISCSGTSSSAARHWIRRG